MMMPKAKTKGLTRGPIQGRLPRKQCLTESLSKGGTLQVGRSQERILGKGKLCSKTLREYIVSKKEKWFVTGV